MNDIIQAYIEAKLRGIIQQQEQDIRQVLGPWARLPTWAAKIIYPRLSIQIIYQTRTPGTAPEYRGIQRHGQWAIDHWAEESK